MVTFLRIETVNALRAILACCACAALVDHGLAADRLAQQSDATPSYAPLRSTAEDANTPGFQATIQQPPELINPIPPMNPPDKVIGTVEPWSEEPVYEPPVETEQPRTGIWRVIPLGMIPHFGPRTPEWEKNRGIGQPLMCSGWLTQPFAISAFSGFTFGSPLIPGHVNQQPSYYGGLNFGYDYDYYWGIEKRLGFGAMRLTDGNDQPISRTGVSITGEYRLMYYPLGDARWRPFITGGIGWSDFAFNDDMGHSHIDTTFLVPYGVGVKYMYTNRWAFRMDLIDELNVTNGILSTFHYVALTAGLEFRYGERLIRMPWHRRDGS